MAPYGCYPSRGEDAWVVIAVETEEQWRAFCGAVGHPEWLDDPRFATVIERRKNQDDLDVLIAAWTAERDRFETVRLLQGAGVPCGPVLNARDLLEDPHLKSRGFFWKTSVVEAPELGEVPIVGPLWKFSRTPGMFRSPAPRLGEHNAVVFGEILGMPLDEIAALEAEGVIGGVPAARPALGVSSAPQKRPGL
jgi:crotonobetainyl-CoA:carnitine CoA-transferase CaiB-like acyl-CoA transferase